MTDALAPTIYFIRHGETDWNAEARLQGQRDVELNGFGRVQAEEVALRLAAVLADPGSVPHVASPLGRARETMEIMRRALGLDPAGYRVEPRLIELTFGRWEGKTWKEVRRAEPAAAAERERGKWGFVPPGGESYADLRERLVPLVAELSAPIVMVSHGGVARCLLAMLARMGEEEATRADIWQGRVLVFEQGRHRWA